MANNFTDYLEGVVINASLRGVNFTAPTSVFIALHTAAPGETGATGEITGVDTYARVAVTSSTAAWSAHGAAGPSSNVSAITFPTAGASWGTITDVTIWDTVTGGNCLYQGTLTTSKAVGVGDTFSFAASQLAITLN